LILVGHTEDRHREGASVCGGQMSAIPPHKLARMAQATAAVIREPLRLRGDRLRAAVLVVVGWALFGLMLGNQVYVLQAGQGPAAQWSHVVVLQLHYCMLWALLTPLVFRLGQAFPLTFTTRLSASLPPPRDARRPGLARALPVHLAAAVVSALVVQLTHAVLLARLFPAWYPPPSLPQIGRSLMGGLDYGFILYWIVTLLGQSLNHLRSLDEARVHQAKLQEQLAEAHLQALRMQMHPHFLFNALNSVAELIHEDPERAEHMLTRLAELLRLYLRSGEAHETTLEEEVEFLQRYLEIQKLRFEERLTVDIRLDPATRDALVPSLILQPLVENALRHGIADRERDGVVSILAAVNDGWLVLSVVDNGDGLRACPPAPPVEGRGLRNTRQRLERLYASAYALSVRTAAGGGTCARLDIPLKRLPPSLRNHDHAPREPARRPA
jgi:signal transduction histidine kinase